MVQSYNPRGQTSFAWMDVELDGCIIWSPLARSLWIDIWASLPRSDVDGIEQADILDLPPECARPPAEPGVEGKERGEKEGEMKGGRGDGCRMFRRTNGPPLLLAFPCEEKKKSKGKKASGSVAYCSRSLHHYY